MQKTNKTLNILIIIGIIIALAFNPISMVEIIAIVEIVLLEIKNVLIGSSAYIMIVGITIAAMAIFMKLTLKNAKKDAKEDIRINKLKLKKKNDKTEKYIED